MRRSAFAGILAATLTSAALAASGSWTPDKATITRLESLVKIPKGRLGEKSVPLNRYRRFYSGIIKDGKPMIWGVFVLGEAFPTKAGTMRPGAYVVPEDDLPKILDGGCGVVGLLYDKNAAKLIFVRCGGYA